MHKPEYNRMKPEKIPLGRIAVALAIGCVFPVLIWAAVQHRADALPERTDIIRISSIRQLAPLQRPPVVFFHDRHTDALKGRPDLCGACHLQENDRLVYKFKRTTDVGKNALMQIYHDNCIGCHQTQALERKKSGPVTCGDCHRKDEAAISAMDPMGFDNSLHYRHVAAADKKCEVCHHEYDGAAKKTVYIQGKEGTCRYCHQKSDQESGMRFQTAGHLSCIHCHQEKAGKGLVSGPMDCRGCHDAGEKSKMKTISPVPRMDRNQPGVVFIKRFDPDQPMPFSEYRMGLVPFDHQAHEQNNRTCRVCHHAGMEACSRCHALTGSDKGSPITLQQAMHQGSRGTSCTGCHEALTDQVQCSGCHAFIEKDRAKDEQYCRTCHSGTLEADQNPVSLKKDTNRATALLETRRKSMDWKDFEKVPEMVVIQALEDRYKPVQFPHGKIVATLKNGLKDNRLAGFFHNQGQKICQGCHHNSPADANPPRCGTCHGKPFDDDRPFVPGLMGAYHQQCMGCHKEMALKKPVLNDCAGCHEEKKEGA